MSRKLGLLAGMAVCALLLGSVVVVAQDADIEGEWTLSFSVDMGRGRTIAVTGVLSLEVDGQDLEGTFVRDDSDTESEVTGEIDGSSIEFWMEGIFGGGRLGFGDEMEAVFEGTVDGETMSGEFEIEDLTDGDWSAERAG